MKKNPNGYIALYEHVLRSISDLLGILAANMTGCEYVEVDAWVLCLHILLFLSHL